MHELTYRVSYADTDKMGVVYYSNYLVLFERGRTELLREAGARYRDVEENLKTYLPAVEAHLEFQAPARYDDLLVILTRVSELGKASVTFQYEVLSSEPRRLLVKGHTRHLFVNERWKPIRVPEQLKTLLSHHTAPFS
ncbi:MAG TPA: thioesterase family protein [Elusimicrobiota bacterium]|nr:thioesterase family protein [Elusimicrobiota bacterium]